jgi:arsenate reductase
MELPLRILFLCTGNSCRSIMAEALANHLGEGRLRAWSAGSHPTGVVNPRALAVLRTHDVPVGEPVSRSWQAFGQTPLDLVITVCDAAVGESCPLWLGATPKVHWGLPDPARVEGDPDTVDAAFEATFRELRTRIEALLALPLDTQAQHALQRELEAIHRRSEDVVF